MANICIPWTWPSVVQKSPVPTGSAMRGQIHLFIQSALDAMSFSDTTAVTWPAVATYCNPLLIGHLPYFLVANRADCLVSLHSRRLPVVSGRADRQRPVTAWPVPTFPGIVWLSLSWTLGPAPGDTTGTTR